jgi:DNA-binding FadR family transcriptional regulator
MIVVMLPRNAHEGVVDNVAGWITGGQVGPGQALPIEAEIAARLSVSRTVVREAIKTLAAKGLVSTGPRVGTRVRPASEWHVFDPQVILWRLASGVDATFIRDVMDFRLALEPPSAALAAGRASAEQRAGIADAYARMVEAVDGRGSYIDADLAFHEGILVSSGNQFFAALRPVVGAILRVSFTHSVKSRESARSSLPLHRAVLDAILARDGDAAQTRLATLIAAAARDIANDLPADDFLQWPKAGRDPSAARRAERRSA